MEALTSLVNAVNGVVWGPMMLVLILGTGLFLQVGLKILPIRLRVDWNGAGGPQHIETVFIVGRR